MSTGPDITGGLPEPVCTNCTLNDDSLLQHPKMLPTGSDTPLIYILGEAPGQQEDEQGQQFVGRAGQFLRKFIPAEVLEHIRWNNVIRCRPPGNRPPQILEMHCCTPLQTNDIATTKPKMVWGFGGVPLAWVSGQVNITRWRGRKFPVKFGEHICWYYPMLHPAYLVRQSGGNRDLANDTIRTFDYDIQRALHELNYLPNAAQSYEPPENYLQGIYSSQDEEQIATYFEWLRGWPFITIDIETTCLRPYMHEALILTIALSNFDGSTTVAMPFTPFVKEKVRELFQDPKRVFNAQNSKFEMEWLSFFVGNEVLSCRWHDTMAQAYILDERQGVLNLGALTQLYFGFDVKSLSDIDTKNMRQEWVKDPENVLRYNALDAKYTSRLHHPLLQALQHEEQVAIYEFLLSTLPGLVLMQQQGLVVNWDEVNAQYAHFADKTLQVEDRIARRPDMRKFMESTKRVNGFGRDANQFNLGSWKQVQAFFADLGIFLESTDEEHLTPLRHPMAKLFLEWRGYRKLSSTYLEPVLSHAVIMPSDGRIHTNMNPYVTGTGRLSSTNPNIQNFPKRDNQEVRNIITVPHGFTGVSGDYGQIEARVIACAANDPYFIKALQDGMDIHMTEAKNLVKVYPNLLNRYGGDWKKLRSDIKNLWVFPAFYGAGLESVAAYLNIKPTILEDPFDDFWHRFRVTKTWQRKLLQAYHEVGYVSTLTGRRRHGPMKPNEIINSPIQGTAHEIVLKSMITLVNISLELDLPYLAPIMDQHDDLTFYLPNDKINDTVPLIAEVMCAPRFDWLTVPLTVEMSTWTNWGTKTEFRVFDSREFS